MNYNYFEKKILSFSLKKNFINQYLLFLEKKFFKKKIKKKIFICGLPRSGSTLLLNLLYSSGSFFSFKYNNLPFFFSPNLVNRLIQIFSKTKSKIQRHHKDDIYIDYESPEAFEEIFWISHLKKKYISKELNFHNLSSKDIFDFEEFLQIYAYYNNKINYISKNNNNILRIKDLINKVKNSIFIIPFRDPFMQARSLHRVNNIFFKLHKIDKFTKTFFELIGHYDFGMTFRKIKFNNNYEKLNNNNNNDEFFFLENWINYYNYFYSLRKNKNIFFFNYDQFLVNPKKYLTFFFSNKFISKLNFKLIKKQKKKISKKNINLNILNKSNLLHKKLIKISGPSSVPKIF